MNDALLVQISRLLSSELTREMAVEFCLAAIKANLRARRAFVLLLNDAGDFVAYPPGGESTRIGTEAPIDVLEDVVEHRKAIVGDGIIAIPLQNQPRPFGTLVVEGASSPLDPNECVVIGAILSGILCASSSPRV